MHPTKFLIPIYALALVTIAASLPGCGRPEAPAASAPDDNSPGALVPDTKPVPPVKWIDATVPEGTPIKLSLIDTLTSQASRKGDPFRALVTDAIMIDGIVTIPSGSNVLGVVSDVISGETGFKDKGGMLALQFNRINTPTGASAPLKARLTQLSGRRFLAVLVGGAAPGTVAAGAKGREAVLVSNTPITVVLDEPLRIKVKQ